MIYFLIDIIQFISNLLVLIIIANVILSYFLTPYQPIRMTLDRILSPLLTPIRRIVKPIHGFDLSSFVLLIIVQVVELLVVNILRSLI